MRYNKVTNETLVLTQEFGWRIGSMTEQVHLRHATVCGTMDLTRQFLSAVAELTEEEQTKLWKELEKDGIIQSQSIGCL